MFFLFVFLENDRFFCYIIPLFLDWDHVESFEAALNLQFGPSTRWPHLSPLYGENVCNVFLKKSIFNWIKKDMHILDGIGRVNYQEIFILEVN